MRRPFRCLAIARKIRAKPADFADEKLFAAISTRWAENMGLGEEECVREADKGDDDVVNWMSRISVNRAIWNCALRRKKLSGDGVGARI
ncbi:hypothetical protein ACOJBO_12270 [Rhizobium beringeri]